MTPSATSRWWSPSQVLGWIRKQRPDASLDNILFELRQLCLSGAVRARWKASVGTAGHYEPSSDFTDIPPAVWIGTGFSRTDPELITQRVYSAHLPRGCKVEVQLSERDVRSKLDFSALGSKRVPSRRKAFWSEARETALRWLDHNGYPVSGDGKQARLESEIARWLQERGHTASESRIRDYVRKWIDEYQHGLSR